ncbi:hypothetical protein QUF74_04040 [Candidatus Halobeggiatoa sp. HSG11]|nr:hypothetical protein [Candidatus Halobeggiatoa sp. HSG11]
MCTLYVSVIIIVIFGGLREDVAYTTWLKIVECISEASYTTKYMKNQILVVVIVHEAIDYGV